jgi:hypothetical protein
MVCSIHISNRHVRMRIASYHICRTWAAIFGVGKWAARLPVRVIERTRLRGSALRAKAGASVARRSAQYAPSVVTSRCPVLRIKGRQTPPPQDRSTAMGDKPISPLRQRMIEDMTVRNFSEKTRNDYIRHVKTFTAFIGRSPDTTRPEDLRRFQLHQRRTGVRPPTKRVGCGAALLLLCDARSSKHGSIPYVCARAAQAAGGVKRGRDRAPARGSPRAEIQGRIPCPLRCRIAGL